ncbi:MAG: hypothetical protein DUD31_02685 [Coriobacteriaceae bacterium]|jgi:hypothetical protein|nr:MAG: hypothetical protein DUD31_02685 [Coriobacteriaceae bacterium]
MAAFQPEILHANAAMQISEYLAASVFSLHYAHGAARADAALCPNPSYPHESFSRFRPASARRI